MSSSREDSPDWLRSYQVPTHSTLNLSSDSDSSDRNSLSAGYRYGSQTLGRGGSDNDEDVVLVEHGEELPWKEVLGAEDDNRSKKRRKKKSEGDGCYGPVVEEQILGKLVGTRQAAKHSMLTLSSDSESGPDNVISQARERKEHEVLESRKDEALVGIKQKSPSKKASTEKSSKKRTKETSDVMEVPEDTSEKHASSHVSSSRLPLVLSEKVNCLKALVECEGESIDLSGDVGAVGRMVILDTPSGDNQEMYFDLKGMIYRTSIVPSRTFCIVSFGQSEAKAIMNDFIQLKPQSNVYEAETMVEGTLEGFSFDSEDEAEKTVKASHQNDQKDEGNEGNVDGKRKGKAQKSLGVTQKRGKTGGKSLPAKKARKKAQATKKTKAKK